LRNISCTSCGWVTIFLVTLNELSSVPWITR
jgi:hypothetical protein